MSTEPNEHEQNVVWVDKLIVVIEKLKDDKREIINEEVTKEIWSEIKKIRETAYNSKSFKS